MSDESDTNVDKDEQEPTTKLVNTQIQTEIQTVHEEHREQEAYENHNTAKDDEEDGSRPQSPDEPTDEPVDETPDQNYNEVPSNANEVDIYEDDEESQTSEAYEDEGYTDEDQHKPRTPQIILDHSEKIRKPFLGGFRDKRNGNEYHHASTQTPPKPDSTPKVEPKVKFHRETQTAEMISRSQQPNCDASTQMHKTGIFYVDSDQQDKVLFPRAYVDADKTDKIRWKAAIRVQQIARGWLARKRAKGLHAELESKRQFIEEQEQRKHESLAQLKVKEIDRRRNPKTKEDFDILYNELQTWVSNEKKQIENGGLDPEEKQSQLRELLSKETKLLQTIDRLKIKAAKEQKQVKVVDKVKQMSSAKKIVNKDGEVTKIQTPFTTRSKELKRLFTALSLSNLTQEERLEVLLQVKLTVEEHDCKLTRDIVELISREQELLKRGRNEKMLTGSRQRLCNLFLQYIETPEFNPEAAKFQQVPMARKNTQPMK